MRRFFWPFVTLFVSGVIFFLWFSARPYERQITAQFAELTIDYPWANAKVTDDDIVLYGMAPNEAERNQLIAKVKKIANIDEVKSQITLLPVAKAFNFVIDMKSDVITLRGMIPPQMDRFALIEKVEKTKPGLPVYDELEVTNGADPHFEQWVDYIIGLSADYDDGNICLSNNKIYFTKEKRKRQTFNAPLPEALKEG